MKKRVKKVKTKIKEVEKDVSLKFDITSLEKGIEKLSKKKTKSLPEKFIEEIKIETESKRETRNVVNLEENLENIPISETQNPRRENQISYQGTYQGNQTDYQSGNPRQVESARLQTISPEDILLYSDNQNLPGFPQIKKEGQRSLTQEFPDIRRDLTKEFDFNYNTKTRREKNPFFEEQEDKYNLPK